MSAREGGLARVLAYLELTVTRKLNGLLCGSFFSAATEEGSEPAGSREYVIDDNVRQMNWAVTARTGVPHVRISEVGRELECWIVAESAVRLSTGLADTTKRHLLTAAAGAITMLNDAPGSRAGLIAGGAPVPAGQGRAHGLMLLKQLADVTAKHNLAADTDTVMTQAPRIGLLVIISDFPRSLGWTCLLHAAPTSTEIMTIRLVDPAGEVLPGEGPVVMADSTIDKTIELSINGKTRAERAAQTSAHHERVISELRKCRARVITLRTDSGWILDLARQIGQH